MNLFGLTAYAGEGVAQAEGAAASGAALVTSFLPLVIIVVLFYFLLIRPQRKRDKENKAMLSAMKVGDKITTIGGICGKVVKIKDNFVYIETGSIGQDAQKSTLKMERDSIKNVEQKKTN